MSEDGKKKDLNADAHQVDDELENLSDDEKSAFEKIMAEIASADDKPAVTGGDPPSADASEPDTTTQQPPDSQDGSNPPETTSATDQAIESNEAPAPDNTLAPSDGPSDDEELSEDQQAALDKIMSEIKDDKEADEPPVAEAPQNSDDDDQEMTDEQQAALDKIMAEIKDDKETDKPPVAEVPQNSDDDDQEMTDEPPVAEAPQNSDDDDQEMTDEQQAALDKIMSEINSGSDSTETADGATPDDTASATPAENPDDQDSNLSIDEFNDELANLLSSVDPKSKSEESAKPVSNDGDTPAPHQTQDPPNSSDESAQQINAALKQIVNEGKETESSEQDDSGHEPDVQQQTYTMLKEVETAEDAEPNPGPAKAKKSRSIKSRKTAWLVTTASILVAVVGLSFWGYRFIDNRSLGSEQDMDAINDIVAPGMPPITREPAGIINPPDSAPIPLQADTPPSSQSPFAAIMQELDMARKQLLSKKQELQDLKAYYQKGILEEQAKITVKTASVKLADFKAVMRDNKIELALRSIQRRMIYMAKLETPLSQVDIALEELLYWQRRTKLLELLNRGISGLPIPEFTQDVKLIMERHLEESKQLSIEKIQVKKPTLMSIWKSLSLRGDIAERTQIRRTQPNKSDLAMGEQICNGNFEELYLLKNLTDQAAACLAKWSGKDLYLNGLTRLTPAVAKSLAQWPGERLSLNGVQSLSAESAKHLSKWPGRWLSLNGLKRLPKDTTAYLAQWQGDQLEMVGLNSIGRWENYVTRLYLSEDLRKKLEAQ